jgi:hypothetical protein
VSEYYPTVGPKPPKRNTFSLFLLGEDVEIGALHQPLCVEGLAITKIHSVDSLPLEEPLWL